MDAELQNADLIAECYIGFVKLLNEELKAFEINDDIFNQKAKSTASQKEKQQIEVHNSPIREELKMALSFSKSLLKTCGFVDSKLDKYLEL